MDILLNEYMVNVLPWLRASDAGSGCDGDDSDAEVCSRSSRSFNTVTCFVSSSSWSSTSLDGSTGDVDPASTHLNTSHDTSYVTAIL